MTQLADNPTRPVLRTVIDARAYTTCRSTRASAPDRGPGEGAAVAGPWRSPHAVFAWCPMCDGSLAPEHAHYRCTACGWRDSCCD